MPVFIIAVVLRLGVIYAVFNVFAPWFLMACGFLIEPHLSPEIMIFSSLCIIQILFLVFIWVRAEKIAICLMPRGNFNAVPSTVDPSVLSAFQSAAFFMMGVLIAIQGLLSFSQFLFTQKFSHIQSVSMHEVFYLFKISVGVFLMLGGRQLALFWQRLRH